VQVCDASIRGVTDDDLASSMHPVKFWDLTACVKRNCPRVSRTGWLELPPRPDAPPGFAIQMALLLPRLPGSVQIIGAWPIPVDVFRVILYREVAVEPLVFGFHVILPEGIPVAVFS